MLITRWTIVHTLHSPGCNHCSIRTSAQEVASPRAHSFLIKTVRCSVTPHSAACRDRGRVHVPLGRKPPASAQRVLPKGWMLNRDLSLGKREKQTDRQTEA